MNKSYFEILTEWYLTSKQLCTDHLMTGFWIMTPILLICKVCTNFSLISPPQETQESFYSHNDP